MTEIEAVKLILKELKRAEKLHPIWPIDKIHAAAIVSEESGELVQAANDFVYPDKINYLMKYKNKMKAEAIQTGAMAIRFLINMDK